MSAAAPNCTGWYRSRFRKTEHDDTFDLLKDYLDWALHRQLRLEHGLSYGPWSEREVLGGVGFLSLNADLERDDLA